jgi:hypothetical protein
MVLTSVYPIQTKHDSLTSILFACCTHSPTGSPCPLTLSPAYLLRPLVEVLFIVLLSIHAMSHLVSPIPF